MSLILAPSPAQIAGGLPRWRDTLAHHYLRLGQASRRFRFLSALGDNGLRQIARSAAPISVLGIEVDGEVRAVLEIFSLHEGHVEIGLSVEDAYQGRGFGKRLFLEGLSEAQRLGATTADVYFASDNARIKCLVASVGADIHYLGYGEARAEVDVTGALSPQM